MARGLRVSRGRRRVSRHSQIGFDCRAAMSAFDSLYCFIAAIRFVASFRWATALTVFEAAFGSGGATKHSLERRRNLRWYSDSGSRASP